MSSIGEAHRETSGRQGYVHYLGRCIRVKTYPVALFKYLQFLAFKLYLNNIDFRKSSLCGSILDAN